MNLIPVIQGGKKTIIMGILNLTPDSFSGDGILTFQKPLDRALQQATQFIEEGADILDIGGESTRPGAIQISADEELGRVIPAIERIRKELGEMLISVDTYKASVAEAALEAGANWVNDIWGMRANPEMAKVISKYNAHVVIMHNRHTIKSVSTDQGLGGHYTEVEYHNLIEDIKNKLMESVSLAREAGIPDANIILDPGIGFGKTVEQNLILINHLDAIVQLGFPVLLGASRKSFIGYTLNLPSDSRLEGSLAANAIGILRGASILRVHDVLETVRMAKMVDAILKT